MSKTASFAAAAAICTSLFASAPALAEKYFQIEDGELDRPTGYREWVYVGTPVTPNDLNDGKAAFPEHHNVYIDPDSWAHWKRTGEFRDGTILMKELISVGSKTAVSGNGYFQGEFIGLEATIKSKKHFPNEPGNWAYFSFSTEDHKTLNKTAEAFPAAACNACHQAAAADDFVFTQYYPVLRGGKGTGKNAVGGTLDTLTATGGQ
ncbi:MAG: cytochrome P460 family protein [Pseudomonadota bacterium]